MTARSRQRHGSQFAIDVEAVARGRQGNAQAGYVGDVCGWVKNSAGPVSELALPDACKTRRAILKRSTTHVQSRLRRETKTILQELEII